MTIVKKIFFFGKKKMNKELSRTKYLLFIMYNEQNIKSIYC